MTPIRPSERPKYPADWQGIRAAVLRRSGGRCECVGECGIDHGTGGTITLERGQGA